MTIKARIRKYLVGHLHGFIEMGLDKLTSLESRVINIEKRILRVDHGLSSMRTMAEDIAAMRQVLFQNEAFAKAFYARRNDSDFLARLDAALNVAAKELEQ